MAITKIKTIKSTLKQAIDYILNPDKTDHNLLSSGFAVTPETAHLEFKMTQDIAKQVVGEYSKGEGNLAYHMIQAFDEQDQLTPELAHQIGTMLADEVLDGKYEYVIATHVDRGHLHNHIIFNATSHGDYKKFNCNIAAYELIREISDKLCREHGLSVIEEPSIAKGKSYYEWQQDVLGQSWKSDDRKLMDQLIKQVDDFSGFLSQLEQERYEIRRQKEIAIKHIEQEHFTKLSTYGEEYHEDKIRLRIRLREKGIG